MKIIMGIIKFIIISKEVIIRGEQKDKAKGKSEYFHFWVREKGKNEKEKK